MQTLSVSIHSDDFKGDLIGRDGCNILAFKQFTGAELIIDDTPKVVFVRGEDQTKLLWAKKVIERLSADRKVSVETIKQYA